MLQATEVNWERNRRGFMENVTNGGWQWVEETGWTNRRLDQAQLDRANVYSGVIRYTARRNIPKIRTTRSCGDYFLIDG